MTRRLCCFWAFQFRFYSYDMSMSNVNCSVHVEDNVVEFGGFSNELQTTTEPYGWGAKFHDPIDAGGRDLDKQLDLLRRDSYIMV